MVQVQHGPREEVLFVRWKGGVERPTVIGVHDTYAMG
jgi:hypothetical protein